ncbi:MAG: hypothetical protein J5840_01230 [Lachnospiraceae bacterium]|nr:hypothetical protein [Lachnospiraceae bacterium]
MFNKFTGKTFKFLTKRYMLIPPLLLIGVALLSAVYLMVGYVENKFTTIELEEKRKTLDLDEYNEYGLLDNKVLSEEILYENEGFIIFSDRVLKKYLINPDNVYYFCNRVNLFSDMFKEDVNVSVMPIPLRVQYESFSTADEYKEEFDNCLLTMNKFLDNDVNLLDCSRVLGDNGGRNLYYRTSYMWNMEGSYYGYASACSVMGTEPYSIDHYPQNQITHFRGGLISSSLPSIPENHEVIPIMQDIEDDPFFYRMAKNAKNYETVKDSESDRVFKRPIISNTVTGNSAVIGSSLDYAIVYGNGTGSLLLVCDDAGKMLAPYFAENYETVIIFDISKYDGENFKEILKPYNVTEILVTETANLMGDRSQSKFLNSLAEE